MSTKTIVVCDQCGHEESNEATHAHVGSGLLPVGWTELHVAVVPPPPPPRQPSSDPDIIDAEFEEHYPPGYPARLLRGHHHHVLPVAKSASLCPECSAKLLIRVGDVGVKFIETGGPTIVGPNLVR
jgi:hypothetical protein